MNSLTTESGSRRYNVYSETTYYTVIAHIHPYCFEITNKKVERIGDLMARLAGGSTRIIFGCRLTVDI